MYIFIYATKYAQVTYNISEFAKDSAFCETDAFEYYATGTLIGSNDHWTKGLRSEREGRANGGRDAANRE